MWVNCKLAVSMVVVYCLLVPAYAQDQYALEVGAGMTVTVNDNQDALRLGTYTYEFWLKDLDGFTGSWRRVFVKGAGAVNTGRGPNVGLFPSEQALQYAHSTGTGQSAVRTSGEIPVNEWIHVALALTGLNGEQMIFLNGIQDAVGNAAGLTQDTQEPVLTIGNAAHVALDDFRVWNYTRTEQEIQAGMGRELLGSEGGLVGYWQFNEGQGTTAFDSSPSGIHGTLAGALWTSDTPQLASALPPGPAQNPSIADGAVDVPRDVMLSWQAGPYAAKHDVYLGTVADDVGSADPAHPQGVLVSQGQTETRYDAGVLDFGQTYYWRVDEVNGPPDNTVYKGPVWSFEVEPFSIPVANIAATASSAHDADMIPEKTIDGSGLDEMDQHSNEPKDMWLSGMGDPTPSIQYEFDRAYKLHELWVWNSNQSIESFVGLGAKDVTIEVSIDGANWQILEDTPPFAQAPGQAGYAHNTVVDMGGVQARYVKLTITAGYGMLPQYGLSEVRFFYIPTFARAPLPADGEVTDSADVVLNWRAGREADTHEVHLGTDPNALTLAGTTQDSSYQTTDLAFATTYYWQIVEVNDAEEPSAYASDIWSFSTPANGVVDDFETYDNECNRIFFAWTDGLGHNGGQDIDDCDVPPSNGNGGGSIVGHAQAPFTEQGVVHSGSQSMPFAYDNAFGPSEASLSFSPQDWTAHGIKSLSLSFYGDPANTGQLYVKINNTKITYSGLSDALQRAQWLPWNIDLSQVAGNLQSVTSLTIGVDGATASGLLYLDDIRLYPLAPETVEPVVPDNGDPNLVAHYAFEGNGDDALGNYPGTVEGGAVPPTYVAGKIGQAIQLDEIDDQVVSLFPEQEIWPAYSVSLWAKTDLFAQNVNSALFSTHTDYTSVSFQIDLDGTDPGNYRYHGTADGILGLATNAWTHLAVSCDGVQTRLYYNGILAGIVNTVDTAFDKLAVGVNRAGDNWFGGVIDEVKVYNRALSDGEIAGLAELDQPFDKPFAAE